MNPFDNSRVRPVLRQNAGATKPTVTHLRRLPCVQLFVLIRRFTYVQSIPAITL